MALSETCRVGYNIVFKERQAGALWAIAFTHEFPRMWERERLVRNKIICSEVQSGSSILGFEEFGPPPDLVEVVDHHHRSNSGVNKQEQVTVSIPLDVRATFKANLESETRRV